MAWSILHANMNPLDYFRSDMLECLSIILLHSIDCSVKVLLAKIITGWTCQLSTYTMRTPTYPEADPAQCKENL